MTKAKTAILLSLCVLPGLGHFYLKRRVMALIFISVSLALMYFIFTGIYSLALEIINQQLPDLAEPMDVSRILESLNSPKHQEDLSHVNTLGNIQISCWVLAALDCYRITRD